MSSGPSIVLNTPTVLLDKDFDPFVDQIVPNYAEEDEGGGGGGGWDQSSCLTDQIFATEIIQHEDEEDEDEHKDENKNQVSSVETVSCSTAKNS